MSSPDPTDAPTRRTVPGGMLTLAIAPALARLARALTIQPALARPALAPSPLVTALEEMRHLYAASLLDPERGFVRHLKSWVPLPAIEPGCLDYVRYGSLALDMGRLDAIRIRNAEGPADASGQLAGDRKWRGTPKIDEATRALPWPPGWAEDEAAMMRRKGQGARPLAQEA